MDGVVWAALVTALGALAVAGFGWWANRKHGLPSSVEKVIRDERKIYEQTLVDKDTRRQQELDAERQARGDDKDECMLQIGRLTDAIIDRDVIIAQLHRRLGLPLPHPTDPRS